MSRLRLFSFTLAAIAPAISSAQPAPAPEPVAPAPTPVAAEPAPVEPEPEPDEVIVVESRAPAESASSVHFSESELRRRPRNQPSDILRQTPGLVVAQHAGGGKSDQYFIRGFDADHGTDVAIFFDGVPVNLTSHGHGQGYADTHWLIPETIASLDVSKGPYAARYGDFYTAGAIELKTIDEVDGLRIHATAGTELGGSTKLDHATYRLVALASPKVGGGTSLLAAELGYADGPFVSPQQFRRGAMLGKWRGDVGPGELSLETTYYAARWNQSGQIPALEIAAGRLDRFGAIDPTEGGAASRSSLVLGYTVPDDRGGSWSAAAYGVGNRLRLYSNFTLFARDPVNGDQIEQTDARLLYGVNGGYRRAQRWGDVTAGLNAGVQVRADDAETSLWHAGRRVRLADCFGVANPCNHTDNRIRNLGAFVEEDVTINRYLQVIGGLRADQFVWDVEDLDPETMTSPETTGGTAQRAILSPKLSVIARPAERVALFVNGGLGFHSNDARAAVTRGGPGALARAYGAEVGGRVEPRPGLRASVDAWYLYLTSEQVWSGDAGGTEASDPTRRYGLDVEGSWEATSWLSLDANVALARSTLVANHGNGGALALAPRVMGGGGVAVHRGTDFVSLRARGIGDRPANDDGSLTADGFFILDLVAARRFGAIEVTATVDNLLNAAWREAQFAEESRVSPTAELVEDVHVTPGMPLTAMLGACVTY
jgi:hypothetical protein